MSHLNVHPLNLCQNCFLDEWKLPLEIYMHQLEGYIPDDIWTSTLQAKKSCILFQARRKQGLGTKK